jgi:hypothetical protein
MDKRVINYLKNRFQFVQMGLQQTTLVFRNHIQETVVLGCLFLLKTQFLERECMCGYGLFVYYTRKLKKVY